MAQLDIDELCEGTQHLQQLSSDLIAPATKNAVRPSTAANGKPGRKSRFTQADDIITAREVAATKAYLSAYVEVNGKSIQDRYKKIQEAFDKDDAKNRNMSGVGGEIGELEELLEQIQEARNDAVALKNAEKNSKLESEKKEAGGEEVVSRAFGTRSPSGEESDMSSAKNKRRIVPYMDPRAGIAPFGESFRESDLARVELELDRLVFEPEKFEQDREESEKDRQERARERKMQAKQELEKFRMMMELFRSQK